ncbi:type II toxin-antitoxin system RelE/ParE family toxin [Candidatus Sumerlaeota bacterium]|nr:type II toxin-antitoxin system RelE/ParE family toxin [Candidatus Sumerlaeota bacterium]
MKVIWTRESLEQLTEIERYIASDNPIKAREFVEYIIRKGEDLSRNPCIGRIVPEISKRNIRERIIKNYRLAYRLYKDKLEILTVFEGHRLLRMDEIKGSKNK